MNAIRMHRFGGPEVLVLEQVPDRTIRQHVAATYPLNDIAAATELLERRDVNAKVVLTP